MTDTNTNTIESRWDSAEYNLTVAKMAWVAVKRDLECSAGQQVAMALDDAKNVLYSTPAPNLGAVADKLTLWGGESLFDDGYEAMLNRKVIGDLRRLGLKAVGCSEKEASGRTPEEAAQQADAWRAALDEYHELLRLFVEGPSPRWGKSDAGDMVSALDCAAGTLLELPAPSIGGVCQKMELLWEDERWDEDGAGIFYLNIMHDLHRLSRPIRPDPQ